MRRHVGVAVTSIVGDRGAVRWVTSRRTTIMIWASVVVQVRASTTGSSASGERTSSSTSTMLLHLGVASGGSVAAIIVSVVSSGVVVAIAGVVGSRRSVVAVPLGVFFVGKLGRQGCVGLLTSATTVARADSSSTTSAGGSSTCGTCTGSTSSKARSSVVVNRVESRPSTAAVTKLTLGSTRRTLAEAEEVGMTGARSSPTSHNADDDQQSEKGETSDNSADDTTDESAIAARAVKVGAVRSDCSSDHRGDNGCDDDLRGARSGNDIRCGHDSGR